jgi:hypothetical protein
VSHDQDVPRSAQPGRRAARRERRDLCPDPTGPLPWVCARLLERGARRELVLHLVVHVAAEIIHRVMVLELIAQGTFTHAADAVQHLKQQPQTIQQLRRYK